MRLARASIALVAGPILLVGCAPRVASPALHAPELTISLDSSGRYTVQRAALDDDRVVELVIDLPKGAATGPELLLVIRSRSGTMDEYPLNPPPTACESPPVEIHFEKLEIRSDAGRDHVWITDPESRLIFATLDRRADLALVLPDRPPSWATLTGGEVLAGQLPPGVFEKQNSD